MIIVLTKQISTFTPELWCTQSASLNEGETKTELRMFCAISGFGEGGTVKTITL
jgi:hypothetical protein